MTFNDFQLHPDILKALEGMGFVTPTEIQEQSIPVLIQQSTDYIGLAQTGTGKTAAFGLPLLQGIDISRREPQALILCPTRELCVQITKEIQQFAKFMKGLNVSAIYGGASMSDQLYNLRKGVHIVVGTPGRMLDHIERKTIQLSSVRTLVLDEADEMLNMGFQEDLDVILCETPKEKQTWLFSATMSKQIESITKKYMTNPMKITVGSRNSSSTTISHQYCVVTYDHVYPALRRFIDFYPDLYGMMFCRTKKETADIAEKLIRDGYAVDTIHGDLSQAQRDAVMKKFREKSIQLLVATDVAARGIDVSDITHVFHYGLPQDSENYTHRSGRTGRAGKSGMSIAILNTREARNIPFLERQIGAKIQYVPVPSGMEICEKQLFHFVHSVHNVEVNEPAIAPFMEKIKDEFNDLTKEQLLTKLVSIEFNRFLQTYANAQNINADMSRHVGSDRKPGKESGTFMADLRSDQVQIKLNIGRRHRVEVGQLINFICRQVGVRGQSIGKITLQDDTSYVGIEPAYVDQAIAKLTGKEYFGTPVIAAKAEEGEASAGRYDNGRSGKRKGYESGHRNRGGKKYTRK